ncbi:Rpn family recombination-promoting nuclease/putative transposase [uncultured Phascolarctobacterium sp.]|uniref:Rpn family recombination-promoting nuclease/putative transposase n=1 Tax=uncultured Phascolarctobacterium sp. TaxID=512296 RepID=UPI0025CD7D69|nr:Rpn family recombination-promoting nuclease/putative transposase [uncultured Phascolarctobacterium sp.]
MGTKDTTQKRLEDFEDIFADISNVLLYDGEDVIKENELETVTAKDTYTVEQQIHEVERDVAKRWRYHSLHISLIGLENQTNPDYKMPLRVICYDGASYRAQLNAEESKKTYPVITLVLYMGTEKHWTAPKQLTDCFKCDERLSKFISNYKINVVELAWLSDEQIMKFKTEFRNFVELLRDTRLGRKPQYSPIQLKHVHELLQLMRVMSDNDEYEQLLKQTTNNLKQNKLKGDEITMKKIVSLGFDEARAEARAAGLAEGEAQEKFATAKRMLALGKSLQDIMLITDLPMSKIQELQTEIKSA